jgi:RNA recognition motif-containing protein
VGGLNPSIPEERIRRYFGTFGKIEHIELPLCPGTNERRAFCFITYTDENPVRRLLETKYHLIGASRCEVKMAIPKEYFRHPRKAGREASITGLGNLLGGSSHHRRHRGCPGANSDVPGENLSAERENPNDQIANSHDSRENENDSGADFNAFEEDLSVLGACPNAVGTMQNALVANQPALRATQNALGENLNEFGRNQNALVANQNAFGTNQNAFRANQSVLGAVGGGGLPSTFVPVPFSVSTDGLNFAQVFGDFQSVYSYLPVFHGYPGDYFFGYGTSSDLAPVLTHVQINQAIPLGSSYQGIYWPF